MMMMKNLKNQFASDNYAGICPEAMQALQSEAVSMLFVDPFVKAVAQALPLHATFAPRLELAVPGGGLGFTQLRLPRDHYSPLFDAGIQAVRANGAQRRMRRLKPCRACLRRRAARGGRRTSETPSP